MTKKAENKITAVRCLAVAVNMAVLAVRVIIEDGSWPLGGFLGGSSGAFLAIAILGIIDVAKGD